MHIQEHLLFFPFLFMKLNNYIPFILTNLLDFKLHSIEASSSQDFICSALLGHIQKLFARRKKMLIPNFSCLLWMDVFGRVLGVFWACFGRLLGVFWASFGRLLGDSQGVSCPKEARSECANCSPMVGRIILTLIFVRRASDRTHVEQDVRRATR